VCVLVFVIRVCVVCVEYMLEYKRTHFVPASEKTAMKQTSKRDTPIRQAQLCACVCVRMRACVYGALRQLAREYSKFLHNSGRGSFHVSKK